MVSGSIAAILYGEPRLTHDVDFVVFLTTDDIRGLQEVFVSEDYHVPPLNVIAIEIAREQRGHFNIIHYDTGFKADFYTSGRDELHSWAFRRVRRMEYRGEPIVVAPPEYVIIRKLEYYREGGSEKHLRDIRSMVAVSRDELNQNELHELLHNRGLETEWHKMFP